MNHCPDTICCRMGMISWIEINFDLMMLVRLFDMKLCEARMVAGLHWSRVTHICVSNLTTIGSDNGLSPDRRQAIIWINAGILLILPLGTNFSETSIETHIVLYKKMRLKMSSAQWRSFCLGFNALTYWGLGLYSLCGKTSYHQTSWSLEAARLGVIMIVAIWNLTGISALLPRYLANFRAIGKV